MKRVSTSILVLVFVFFYIFCISAYIFISGVTSIKYLDKKINPSFEAALRLRRDVSGRNDTRKNNVSFNVCCGRDEYLTANVQCVKFNVTEKDSRDMVIPEAAVLDEYLAQSSMDLNRVFLEYEFKELCPKEEMKVITWPEGQTYSYYISQETGHLLELSNDRKSIASKYSKSSFCLDTMIDQDNSRMYAALFCPCKENLCISKCCPKGQYHNVVTGSCKEESEGGIVSYKPNFPEGLSYHLVRSIPECNGPDRMIADENDIASPITILETGQLMTLSKEKGIFDRNKYCVDVFSDGNNNSSYVNGFYCPNEAKIIIEKSAVLQKVNKIEFSSNTSNSVIFEFLLLILCFLFSVS